MSGGETKEGVCESSMVLGVMEVWMDASIVLSSITAERKCADLERVSRTDGGGVTTGQWLVDGRDSSPW